MQHATFIKGLVAKGKLDQAVKTLLDSTKKDFPKELNYIINISRRYESIKNQAAAGVISNEDFQLHLNRITLNLLAFIDDLQEYTHSVNTEASSVITIEKDKRPIFIGRKITKAYQSNAAFFLNPVDIQLKEREITSIIGKNAAGKTTLLNIIAGIIANSNGELSYLFDSNSKRLNWQKIKQHIAYIPQHLKQWTGTVKENLHFTAAINNIKGDKNDIAVNYALHRLNLEDFQERYYHELSGGYRMRFELAKTLVWNPSLLILDEPLAHLDIAAQKQFLSDIRSLCTFSDTPFSVLISSQHIHEVEAISDHLIFFKDGKIIFNNHQDNITKKLNTRLFELTFKSGNHSQEQETTNLIINDIHKKIGESLIDCQFKNGEFLIRCERFYTTDKLLLDLSALSIQHELLHFREITNSTKKFFYD